MANTNAVRAADATNAAAGADASNFGDVPSGGGAVRASQNKMEEFDLPGRKKQWIPCDRQRHEG
ncbi:hypothetical protein PF005_g32006 [Phytophthora fragariae]|uniref:Uncharacterized protein n=1 Tax=Phytophthora fragariae TaxID=53985 RepID=A0A6A3V2B9_9STRA|nr:hypothetical protein PF009_g28958 [Phytophthora fragariae]KAE9159523.1 hypothetical protein PF005_g32006 [Phytophthora fragariae]KAE9174835.1 hypothetical protein PF004_g26560 [Phytophthora fragariae]KAE9269292.1 hypothetical protein PF001_g29285 [Phytophthora fragariae]